MASILQDHDLHHDDWSHSSAFSMIDYTPTPFQTASEQVNKKDPTEFLGADYFFNQNI